MNKIYNIFRRKKRSTPLYKKLIKLRENIQDREKVLNFKKKKWEPLITHVLRSKFRRHKKKLRRFDMNKFVIKRYYNWYKNRYKNNNVLKQKFKLFYGYLSERRIKKMATKAVREIKKNKCVTTRNQSFLKLFDKRLDAILYKAKFVYSIKYARQLIKHKKITVNGKTQKDYSYLLKKGDIIGVKEKIERSTLLNVAFSECYPLPPKYLYINYRTLKILYMGSNPKTDYDLSFDYKFWLDINEMISIYRI